MKTAFKKSFLKEIEKLKNKKLKDSIADIINHVEVSSNISTVKNIKKLTGYGCYYRIRIRDYRIGLKIEDEIVHFCNPRTEEKHLSGFSLKR